MESRNEEWFCAQWGMRKPQCLQMSSLDPSKIFQVPGVWRCNGLHAQLAERRAIILCWIWFEASGFSSCYLCMTLALVFMVLWYNDNNLLTFLSYFDRPQGFIIPYSISGLSNMYPFTQQPALCEDKAGNKNNLFFVFLHITHLWKLTMLQVEGILHKILSGRLPTLFVLVKNLKSYKWAKTDFPAIINQIPNPQ